MFNMSGGCTTVECALSIYFLDKPYARHGATQRNSTIQNFNTCINNSVAFIWILTTGNGATNYTSILIAPTNWMRYEHIFINKHIDVSSVAMTITVSYLSNNRHCQPSLEMPPIRISQWKFCSSSVKRWSMIHRRALPKRATITMTSFRNSSSTHTTIWRWKRSWCWSGSTIIAWTKVYTHEIALIECTIAHR